MPTAPGVHICGLLKESQLPAHARPFAATVTAAVLLDWYVTGSVIVALAEFKTDAINAWFVPISSDRFVAGLMVMLAGTGNVVVWMGLLLLQPARPATRKKMGRATANLR